MYNLKRILFVIFALQCLTAVSQELPPIHNFTTLDYNAGNQNWAISQSQDKIIYVANNDGLLEFNGANWTSYPSPNETIMRSVTVIDDRVYTGCFMEFGYWKRNNFGKLDYYSLSQALDIELVEDEEIWNIIGVDNWVVFQSLHRIYVCNPEDSSVQIIESEEVINKIFQVGDKIFFQRLNKGVHLIDRGSASIFIDEPTINSSEVINIFNHEDGLLIITRNNGAFIYKNKTLEKLQDRSGSNLFDLGIYSAIQLHNKNFVLGTISLGLLYLDQKLNRIFKIDQSTGLLNNTVLSIFEDQDNNVWTGLDNGLSYINIDAPIRSFKDNTGIIGSVYASLLYEDNLYLGTNQGLYYKQFGSDEEIRLIEGTQGQVWCLKEIAGTLFCGHHNGTFIIQGNQANKVSDIQGTWNIDQIGKNADLIIQGNYDGLYVLEKSGPKWLLRNKLKGFSNSSRYFEVLNNEIFVNHEYKGVFKLTIDEAFSRVTEVKIDTLLKGTNSSVSKYRGEVLYASKEGIFTYDTLKDEFFRDEVLSKAYTEEEYISGRIILGRADDSMWIFTKNSLSLITSGNLSDEPKITKIPLTLAYRRDVLEHENIISIDQSGQFVIGTTSGYLIVDIAQLNVDQFEVFLDNINVGINEDHSATENLVDKKLDGVFGHKENNFRISYYTPNYYEYLKPTYQFQLEGLYDVWGDWTKESKVFFENIPPGDYTFNVRAKVGNKVSENTASYNFTILKPWYINDYMLFIYLLVIVFLSIAVHHVYKRYYKNQQQRLIHRNRREMELAVLQKEKEIIKIKNDQLEKDFKNKSNEAAASAISIVKKNELLMQIKEQLTQIENRDSLNPVIKIINRNLSHDENWKLFKEAFDNSDHDFFKKIKEIHPDLSPNDLKLCAYLRLNLSSKEIAPLFSISPRSVEIKRYRLRRKMNLDSNENLTEYILSI